MTDNEIFKMMNEFISRNEDVNYAAITIDLLKDILDLINRQQAVIEKQRENNKAIMQTIADVHTEAIKEFAEKAKSELGKLFASYEFLYIAERDVIDNLVKEMVGDTE